MSTDIIENIVPTQRTRELVRLIIPVLIRWAKSGKTDMTYGDLSLAVVGRKQYRLGHQLGQVHNVIDELQAQSGVKIPTLNTLVKNRKGFPSSGFHVVYPSYNKLSDDEKRVFIEGLDSKAIKFKRWDWVLDQLGLEPVKLITEEELHSKTSEMGGSGSEGKNHKRLKKFILEHPESIGLKDVVYKTDEFILAIVEVDGSNTKTIYLKNPFKGMDKPTFAEVSRNFNIMDLISNAEIIYQE